MVMERDLFLWADNEVKSHSGRIGYRPSFPFDGLFLSSDCYDHFNFESDPNGLLLDLNA